MAEISVQELKKLFPYKENHPEFIPLFKDDQRSYSHKEIAEWNILVEDRLKILERFLTPKHQRLCACSVAEYAFTYAPYFNIEIPEVLHHVVKIAKKYAVGDIRESVLQDAYLAAHEYTCRQHRDILYAFGTVAYMAAHKYFPELYSSKYTAERVRSEEKEYFTLSVYVASRQLHFSGERFVKIAVNYINQQESIHGQNQ